MPDVQGKALIYTQPYYDTLAFPISAAGALQAQFFAVPFGGALTAAINKNFRHTNLVQAGRLERGNQLRIGAMTLAFPVTAEAGALPTVADKRAVRAGNIRLVFGGDTNYLTVNAAEIPQGAAGEVVVDATVALNDIQNGVPVVQNKFWFDEEMNLASQESVSVFLENMDAIAAVTEVRITLWGTATRPVR